MWLALVLFNGCVNLAACVLAAHLLRAPRPVAFMILLCYLLGASLYAYGRARYVTRFPRPRCARCEYDTFGLVSAECPECGIDLSRYPPRKWRVNPMARRAYWLGLLLQYLPLFLLLLLASETGRRLLK